MSAGPLGETGKALPTTDRDTSRHRWASSNRCATGSTALGREGSLEDRILDALFPRFAPAVLLCNIWGFWWLTGRSRIVRRIEPSPRQSSNSDNGAKFASDCFKVLEIARIAPNVVEQENMEMHVEIENVARTDVDILMDGGDGQNNV
ncbi:hypothetical protein C8J56DRAFT_893613 [Mycena floridula]|nr:hypothetical protein C8J56DRAFT_893613 [Mycena floridula]